MNDQLNLLKDTPAADFFDVFDNVLENDVNNFDTASNYISNLLNDNASNDYRVGGLLYRVQKNGWWKDEYQSFKECIEKEFGLSYRKAMYLMDIYNGLSEADITWDSVKDIGWSKLKELVKVINTDNLDYWIDKAKSYTVLGLRHLVKEELQKKQGTAPDEPSKNVSMFTAQVHEDQKETITTALDKAKGDLLTESTGVALDAICMSFLEGGTAKPTTAQPTAIIQANEKDVTVVVTDDLIVDYVKSLSAGSLGDNVVEQVMRNVGYYKIFELFDSIWPDVDIQVALPTD